MAKITVSRFRRILIYFGMYFVSLMVQLLGFGVPYWEKSVTNSAGNRSCIHRGLWKYCEYDQCSSWGDSGKDEDPTPGYIISAQAGLCVSLVLTIMAGICFVAWITQHKDQKLMVLTCIMLLSTGLINIASVCAFAFAKSEETAALFHLQWGFWTSVASACMLTAVGAVVILDRCILTSLVHHLADIPSHLQEPRPKLKSRQGSQDISDYFARLSRSENEMKTYEKNNRGFLASDTSVGVQGVKGADSSNGSLNQVREPRVSVISDGSTKSHPDMATAGTAAGYSHAPERYSRHYPVYTPPSGAGKLT